MIDFLDENTLCLMKTKMSKYIEFCGDLWRLMTNFKITNHVFESMECTTSSKNTQLVDSLVRLQALFPSDFCMCATYL